MPYGTVKVDNVTFTNNSVDATTTFSGIYASITNNLTLSGTATAATFTGTTANFTNVNAQNISVTTSLSGLAITGGTAGFTTITGTTVTGTTANFATLSGTTVTGTTARFITITGGTAGFTTITGTTVTGTTANFVTVSGTTVTGTTASFTSGIFTSLSGTTHTITSGVFALGTAALPSISFVSDPNTGIYSPGADQLAVATNGTGRLFVDASGNVGVGISNPGAGASGGARILNIAAGSPGAISTLTFGDTNAIGVIESVNGNGVLKITTGDSIQFVTSSSSERARIRSDGTFEIKGAGTAGVSPGFSVNPSTPANSFVIDSSGRLGIGTSSPSSLLHLGGTASPNVRLESSSGPYSLISSNTVGSLVFEADANGTGASSNMSFLVDGTSAIRINSSGNVGVGTTSPNTNSQLHIAGSSYQPLYVDTTSTGGGGALFFRSGTQALYVGTGGSAWLTGSSTADALVRSEANLIFATGGNNQRAQIDSSGRLLVGTSTNDSYFGSKFQIAAGNGEASSLLTRFSANASGPVIFFGKSRSATVGTKSLVSDGDTLGGLEFYGSGAADWQLGAKIEAQVDGTPESGGDTSDMPGRLVFSTTADGAASPTERLRIDSSGRLLVGTSSTLLGLTSSTLHVNGTQAAVFVGDSGSAGNQVLYVQHTNTSGDNLFIEFGTEASLTTRGSIDYNRAAGLVRYNVTSDRRLKSAIQPATSAVDLLSSIQVRSYKWTETDYTVNYGFIAQELHQVLPDAVKVGDDGEKVQDAWAVDNSKVVPLLTAALQEAIAKIENLEARLTAAGID